MFTLNLLPAGPTGPSTVTCVSSCVCCPWTYFMQVFFFFIFVGTVRPLPSHLVCLTINSVISSVRSSYSHPDLLVIHPLFQITPVLNTGLSLSEPLQLYKLKAIMLYKGNHWTRCAGFIDASWVRLGITNDD